MKNAKTIISGNTHDSKDALKGIGFNYCSDSVTWLDSKCHWSKDGNTTKSGLVAATLITGCTGCIVRNVAETAAGNVCTVAAYGDDGDQKLTLALAENDKWTVVCDAEADAICARRITLDGSISDQIDAVIKQAGDNCPDIDGLKSIKAMVA